MVHNEYLSVNDRGKMILPAARADPRLQGIQAQKEDSRHTLKAAFKISENGGQTIRCTAILQDYGSSTSPKTGRKTVPPPPQKSHCANRL